MSSLKYKLINNQTKEEHLCDKVTIEGFDYYVSDDLGRIGSFITNGKEVEQVTYRNMVTGNYSIKPNGRTPMAQYRHIMEWDIIIATNNPNIDIPKVVDEVERLAESIIPNLPYKKYVKTGFIGGYNKSQETHSNSDEDMIEFERFCSKHDYENGFGKTDRKELLQLWKEQKTKTLYYET